MTIWVVRCGGDSNFEQEAYDQGIVGIGWGALGDISKFETIEELRSHYAVSHPHEKPRTQIACSTQVFAFSKKMQKGDLVSLPIKSLGAIAFGKIVGDYKYVPGVHQYVSHQRKVEWIGEPIPRSSISQDLLYSFGAFLTVFQVTRNDAENRIRALLSGKKDSLNLIGASTSDPDGIDEQVDLESVARDQIRKLITQKFTGHALARLVGEIMRAQGYVVQISPEGPDGGVDVLAGSGSSGFEAPRIAVQVKSGVVDAPTVHQLQGTMKNFEATNGLIVAWGGFNSAALKEGRRLFFSVKMWDSDDLIKQLFDNYDRLSDEIKIEIPLKKIWSLLPEEV
jgi:restriction system protein